MRRRVSRQEGTEHLTGGDYSPTVEAAVDPNAAFFPFPDGVDQAAEAGVTVIAQPGGSVKDPEVIAAADAHGIAMVFTGQRLFRH